MIEKMNIDINTPLEQCENFTQEQKKELFQSIFHALKNEQDILHSRLLERVPMYNKEDISFPLVTCVAPSNQVDIMKSYNLFPICMPCESIFPASETVFLKNLDDTELHLQQYCGFAFLNCDYVELQDFLERKFKGEYIDSSGNSQEITYTLSKSEQYIKEEKILFETVQQNNLHCPPIYSPMSRRVVNVMVHRDIDMSKGGSICFHWDKNDLSQVIITDSLLYSNLKREHSRNLPVNNLRYSEKIVPFFEEIYTVYEYINLGANEFIWVDDMKRQFKRDGNILYIPLEDNILPSDFEYMKLKICEVSENITYQLFPTNFKHSKVKKERVVTLGDIDLIISQFETLLIQFEKVKTSYQNKSIEPIATYARLDSYNYSKIKMPVKSTPLYLAFQKNENDIYFVDKVSYMLDFMNYFYPEFRYVGVFA